jgi:hypothetical protein
MTAGLPGTGIGGFFYLLLAVFYAVSLHDYFNRWATDDTVRREHQAGIAQIARQIDQLPADRPSVFSSGAVTHWNPWSVTAFRLTAPLGCTATRWFDARSSFIFPQGQTDLKSAQYHFGRPFSEQFLSSGNVLCDVELRENFFEVPCHDRQ